MAVLIDPPRWPAHGRLWSHLASDSSLDELHSLAAAVGIPRRAFEGDHYDVPAEHFDAVVAAGALEVEGRELLRRLVAAGLRVPKRRGERVLASAGGSEPGAPVADVVASRLPVPDDRALGAWVLVTDAAGRVLVRTTAAGPELPGCPLELGAVPDGSVVAAAVRALAEQVGVAVAGRRLRPVGYQRLRHRGLARAAWSYRPLFVLDRAPARDLAPTSTAAGTAWTAPAEAVLALAGGPFGPLVAHLLAPGAVR